MERATQESARNGYSYAGRRSADPNAMGSRRAVQQPLPRNRQRQSLHRLCGNRHGTSNELLAVAGERYGQEILPTARPEQSIRHLEPAELLLTLYRFTLCGFREYHLQLVSHAQDIQFNHDRCQRSQDGSSYADVPLRRCHRNDVRQR